MILNLFPSELVYVFSGFAFPKLNFCEYFLFAFFPVFVRGFYRCFVPRNSRAHIAAFWFFRSRRFILFRSRSFFPFSRSHFPRSPLHRKNCAKLDKTRFALLSPAKKCRFIAYNMHFGPWLRNFTALSSIHYFSGFSEPGTIIVAWIKGLVGFLFVEA